MSHKKFSSDKDISRYDLERIQGIATGRSRLITQGGSLPDYQRVQCPRSSMQDVEQHKTQCIAEYTSEFMALSLHCFLILMSTNASNGIAMKQDLLPVTLRDSERTTSKGYL